MAVTLLKTKPVPNKFVKPEQPPAYSGGPIPEIQDERPEFMSERRALDVRQNTPEVPPGIFSDSVTSGLQRPLAGLVAGISPWMHPGTSFGERYRGGADAYDRDLNRQIEEHPRSALAQQIAGGLVMGGPSGSIWKQGAFDAAQGGVQSAAGGSGWSDIARDALLNAGLGGIFNLGGAGVGKTRQFAADQESMLSDILPERWR